MRYAERARIRQAQFRRTLPEAARTPTDALGLRHGHLLTLGAELHNLAPSIRGDDGVVPFFRARGIQWWTSSASGDVGQGHPTRNLASSQVACVNVLFPLAAEPAALLAFARAIDPEITELVPIPDPRDNPPSLVDFEWVGWSAPLEGGRITRGANQTSTDALIVGRTPRGVRALVIEWKYTEAYRSPQDKGAGDSGRTRLDRYTDRYHAADSSFRGDVPLPELLFEPYYQLMRLRLLADEVVRSGLSPTLPVADATVVVVAPSANEDYLRPWPATPLARRFPEAQTVVEVLQGLAKDPATFRFVDVDVARHAAFEPMFAAGKLEWSNYLAARYGGDIRPPDWSPATPPPLSWRRS